MAPNILLTETQPSNTLSPNISLSDFSLPETNPTTHDRTTTPNTDAAVACDTLAH